MSILDYLENKYLSQSNSYFKQIIKNILGFTIHTFSFQTEKITFEKTSFFVYKNRLTKNDELLKDSYDGYIRYYQLKKGDVVVDAGAYAGIFTIYAAKKVGPKGKVIAFEPDPYASIILKKNITLNQLKNVVVIKKGLFDREDTLPFDIQGPPSHIVPEGENCLTFNFIITTTLDKELRRLKIRKVNFIKMDIEGAEVKALNGCQQTIKNSNSVHLAIACYHLINGKPSSIQLKNDLRQLKMRVWLDNKIHPVIYAEKPSPGKTKYHRTSKSIIHNY